MTHIALLGDSVLDNAVYVAPEKDVATQLQALLPRPSKCTLLAADGSVTADMPRQLERLPRDATHLVLSVGGNDALQREEILTQRVAVVAEALLLMETAVAEFETAYRAIVQSCTRRNLPLIVCTIYNGNFPDKSYARCARIAVAIYNDAIIRIAAEAGARVLDLREICREPADYANPIEPSAIGSAKIAQSIHQLCAQSPDGSDGRGWPLRKIESLLATFR